MPSARASLGARPRRQRVEPTFHRHQREAHVIVIVALASTLPRCAAGSAPLGPDDTHTVIAVSVLGGMGLMLALLAAIRACRRRNMEYMYSRVEHELDDEEQQFKRTLESQVRSIAGGWRR